jgi:hypothetical protein
VFIYDEYDRDKKDNKGLSFIYDSYCSLMSCRSVPVAVASLFDLITINLFNQLVEQPFVKKMYIDKRPIT